MKRIKKFLSQWNEVYLGYKDFRIGFKKDQNQQTEGGERDNLEIEMRSLHNNILKFKKCESNQTPFIFRTWIKKHLYEIGPSLNQIKPDNWPNWLTKEEKEKFQRAYQLVNKFTKLVKEVKENKDIHWYVKDDPKENNDLNQYAQEIYNNDRDELIRLTAEFIGKNDGTTIS